MERRELLAGAAGLLVAGGGAAYTLGGLGDEKGTTGVEPATLDTVDAPGSPGTELAVPERGRVSLVEFFATWCTVCSRTMDPLGEVHADFGDEVQFVSVTNEPVGRTVTEADVADWWRDHDGAWPVALDGDLVLTERLEATGVPYAFVFDEDNGLQWSHRGYAEPADFATPLRDALDDGS